MKHKRTILEIGYWIYILSSIVIFTFFIPPFEKPDEIAHFKRAYALSDGHFACRKTNEGYGYTIPLSVDTFPKQMFTDAIIMQGKNKFPYKLLIQKYPIDNTKTVLFTDYCSLPVIAYIPASFGILLTRPFNDLVITFYGARLGMVILFLVSLILSFRLLSKGPRLLLVLFSAIPMVLHQATAVSYDSPSLSLSILTCTYFIFLAESKSIRMFQYIQFFSFMSIFLLMKHGYYILFGLAIPLIWNIQTSLRNKIIIIGLSGIAAYSVFLLAQFL